MAGQTRSNFQIQKKILTKHAYLIQLLLAQYSKKSDLLLYMANRDAKKAFQ